MERSGREMTLLARAHLGVGSGLRRRDVRVRVPRQLLRPLLQRRRRRRSVPLLAGEAPPPAPAAAAARPPRGGGCVLLYREKHRALEKKCFLVLSRRRESDDFCTCVFHNFTTWNVICGVVLCFIGDQGIWTKDLQLPF